jgi:hypothetical protein
MAPPAQVMASPSAASVVREANDLRLTEMQIAELREAFTLFDKVGTAHTLLACWKSLPAAVVAFRS